MEQKLKVSFYLNTNSLIVSSTLTKYYSDFERTRVTIWRLFLFQHFAVLIPTNNLCAKVKIFCLILFTIRNYFLSFFLHKRQYLSYRYSILCECNNAAKTEHYRIENKEKSIAQFVKKRFDSYATEKFYFVLKLLIFILCLYPVI